FGRYELLTSLGRGGMAEVFLARMAAVGGFSKLLVIKRMLPHLSDSPEFVDMFLTEARITAKLLHPNICQVFELGDVDGVLYIAMEYLDGLAWADLVPLIPRVGGGFELRCAAAVVTQAAEGLRYAHDLRDADGNPTPVIHRDVSPENLFVTREGIAKVLDFGVSKMLTEVTRTRTGTIKGKLPYMAPEQIEGGTFDARVDVFSLGVVLWEALTGEFLFRRDTEFQIWKAITEEIPPPVTSRRPDLPPDVDRVVARALSIDREHRYPTIRALSADIRQVANQVGGPLDQQALAEAVRSLGAEVLAQRDARIRKLMGDADRMSANSFDSFLVTAPRAKSVDALAIGDARAPSGEALPAANPPAPGGAARMQARTPVPQAFAGSGEPTMASAQMVQVSNDATVGYRDQAVPLSRPRWRFNVLGAFVFLLAAGGVVVIAMAITGEDVALHASDTALGVPEPSPAPGPAYSSDTPVANHVRGDAAIAPVQPAATGGSHGETITRNAQAAAADTAAALVDGNPGAPVVATPAVPDRDTTRARPRAPTRSTRQPAKQHAAKQPPPKEPPVRPEPTVPSRPGRYSIDSKPYAKIYIDGQLIGDTPVYQAEVPPGRHRVKAVLESGKTKTFEIDIESGKRTSSGVLTW
ncbi:MAG: protein kinase, partial [Kofleriaceae bacterium]